MVTLKQHSSKGNLS